MNCYSIAVLEGWALAMDRLALDPERYDLEMRLDGHRRKRLAMLFGVKP